MARFLEDGKSGTARAWHEALHREALIDSALLDKEVLGRDAEVFGVGDGGIDELGERVGCALGGHHEHIEGLSDGLAIDQSCDKADFAGRLSIVRERCGDQGIDSRRLSSRSSQISPRWRQPSQTPSSSVRAPSASCRRAW